jgi:hypothetical protein
MQPFKKAQNPKRKPPERREDTIRRGDKGQKSIGNSSKKPK